MGPNQTIYTVLRTRYLTGWTPPMTQFVNEPFVKPGTEDTPAIIWARFTVIAGPERQLDIGDQNKTFRTLGQVTIQLFAPTNTGCIDLLEMADNLAAVFRNWSGLPVVCREAEVREIGEDKFGWYQINVVVNFKSDNIH